jgi:hypothetical protein
MKSQKNILQMSNDELAEMLGRTPNEVLRRQIIDEVRETGCDVREAVAKHCLPKIALLDSDGTFYCEKYGGRITPAEWVERNPLGKYARIVIITPK